MTDRDRDSSLWSSDSIIATRRNRNLYSSFISVYFKSQIIAIHSMVRKHRIAAYIKGHTEQLLKICLVLKIHQVVLQNSFQYLFFYIYEIDIRSVKFIRIQTSVADNIVKLTPWAHHTGAHYVVEYPWKDFEILSRRHSKNVTADLSIWVCKIDRKLCCTSNIKFLFT